MQQEIITLENGWRVEIRQPLHIRTDFCFSYGQNGVYDHDEYLNAEQCAEIAKTRENYFIQKNLKQLDYTVADVPGLYCLKLGNGCARLIGCPEYYNREDVEPLTDGDRQNIARSIEKIEAAFLKRLKTYLKRYGLTKIRTWSYLSD